MRNRKFLNLAMTVIIATLLGGCKFVQDDKPEQKNDHTESTMCEPGAAVRVTYTDRISHSLEALLIKTCNQDGKEFSIGECKLLACDTGYHALNNLCVLNTCYPNETGSPESCASEISHSLLATKSKVCNGEGSGYVQGACTLQSCKTDYIANQNQCIPVISISRFLARYYDGSSLVKQEMVDRPAINYAWSDFLGINSYDFAANWTGTVTINGSSPRLLNINFDISWAVVSLKVDGQAASSPIIFTPGTHTIEIDFANNWHTTSFNASFTYRPQYTLASAEPLIRPLVSPETKIVYVGAYESSHLYNEIAVSLGNSSAPVFVFVSSYSAATWKIVNPYNVEIKGIAVASYGPRSIVIANEDIPVFSLTGLSYGYSDFTNVSSQINTLTGKSPDKTLGGYGISSIFVPDL